MENLNYDINKNLAIDYYGCTCHNCGLSESKDHLRCMKITDYDEYDPENLVLLCPQCYCYYSLGIKSNYIENCLENRKKIGLHKIVLALREYYVKSMIEYANEEYPPYYGYLFDIMEALRGHSEYFSCIYWHIPYKPPVSSPADMDYNAAVLVAQDIYSRILEGEVLREEQ